MVGSISVQPSWSRTPYDPRSAGDLKLCFVSGVYAVAYEHVFDKRSKQWVWDGWPLVLITAPSGSSNGGG